MEIKKEAVIQEIKICQDIIDKYERKLEESNRALSQMTDRLAVLNALDKKLPGTQKALNAENIKNLAKQRNELIPDNKNYQNIISNMQVNLKALNELLEE